MSKTEKALAELVNNTLRTTEHKKGTGRIPAPIQVLTPSEAILAESEYVDAPQCVGRVLAEPLVHMPPCVPAYMCGEVLGEDAVRFINGRVRVVKEPVGIFRRR